MKRTLLVWALITVSTAFAEVIINKQEPDDKSSARAEIIVITPDRQTTPLVIDTKKTKPDDTSSATERIVRTRLSDGTYFESQRRSSRSRQVSPDVTETTTEVVEKDRQGGERVNRHRVETLTKTADGEELKAAEYRRTSDGQLVLDKQVAATTTKNPDGTTTTVRVEKQADFSGRLVPKQEREETTTTVSETEKRTTAKVKGVDHIEGRFDVIAEETAVIRTEGNTTQTQREVRSRTRSGWTVTEKVATTETRAADGTIQRETVEQGRSMYTKSTGEDSEPLLPKRKIVERETRQADGTIVQQRDEFRRDVNGEWKPASYSKDTGAGER